MKYRLRSYRLGFTLIELMVVVGILGILMAAGIVAFSGAQRVARDAKRRADVDAIAKAYEQLYADIGNMFGAANNSQSVPWTSGYNLLFPYFTSSQLPVDPMNTGSYAYWIHSLPRGYAGTVNPSARFCISARLETPNGNCTGAANRLDEPNAINCFFTTPGTGTHYCVPNRQ